MHLKTILKDIEKYWNIFNLKEAVAKRIFVDWVFRSQSYRRQTNDNYDEIVEGTCVDDAVDQIAQWVCRREEEEGRVGVNRWEMWS